jgi:hypothetical protein
MSNWLEKALGFVPVVGPILGAITGSRLSKAIGKEQEAAESAAATEWRMYEQMRADLAPYREAGVEALGALRPKVLAGPGRYVESPDYQLGYTEGVKAIDRMASAGGYLGSGARRKALVRYAGDYRMSDYDKFLDRYYRSLNPLQSMAGIGQTTTTGLGELGLGVARSTGELGQTAGYWGAERLMAPVAGLGWGLGQGLKWWSTANREIGTLPTLQQSSALGRLFSGYGPYRGAGRVTPFPTLGQAFY